MENLKDVWTRLDARRRAIVAGATIAMLAAVALLARGPGDGEMALLYAGLDDAAAGEVVAALESRGVAHDVRGDAIWVPATVRDLERMTLAAEGLPASSSQGYELLDALSGFGTTAQMFDAAYWRAKEGELARTILAVPDVSAVRVHIAAGVDRTFRRGGAPTAGVTVTTRGAPLDAERARAVRHLVAAAVPGLLPSAVAVIDTRTGLVPDEAAQAPDSRAEELAARAERLLEARVGPGNAVVEVSVDTVTEAERLTERRIDPESRVAISTETEESASSGRDAGGAVTVASNLPDGEAQGEGSSSSEETSRATTNYELSETSREVVREPGAIRRLTVAVLVNDVPGTDDQGAVSWTPRPAEELAALGALVGAAVGVDEARGDVLTVKSLPFQTPAALGSEAAPATAVPWDTTDLLRQAILAIVALVLGLFVVRPLLRSRPGPALLPSASLPPPLSDMASDRPRLPQAAEPSAPGAEPLPADPAARLRRLVESRQHETARILQSWIEDAPRAGTGRA